MFAPGMCVLPDGYITNMAVHAHCSQEHLPAMSKLFQNICQQSTQFFRRFARKAWRFPTCLPATVSTEPN